MQCKTVVLCGSARFMDIIQHTAELIELEKGWAVIGLNPHVLPRPLTEAEQALLGELHLTKIRLADAIFVVNPGGYIGQSVQREIAFARSLGKEILYLEPVPCTENR